MRGTVAVLVLVLATVRVGDAAHPAAQTTVIELRDDSFDPAVVRVAPGDTVTWINRGRNPHDVVANDGAFASKILQTGDAFSVSFPKIGHFPYFCSLHGTAGAGMHGDVYVGVAPEEAYATSASRTYPADPPVRPAGGRTLRVPHDFPTIQAAVDAAKPGDLVLIAAGTYRESVKITTPHLTLRGEDRNLVILDGGYDPALKNGVAVFGADGVVVENMTARHYTLNGFYWRSVWGYRGSYLTADGNGDYGIYAFDSGVGQFDHSYASGSPDSGFYIGQCDPCNALITDVVARWNAIGFSGTNASGNLVIRDSEWSENMSGIVPNTLDAEGLAPQRGQTVVGNWVHDNNNRDAPAKAQEFAFFGTGITVLGGDDNEIAFNRVERHENAGIAVAFVIDERVWLAEGNRVHDNVVTGSGLADLALIAPAGGRNCFAANDAATSLPPLIETLYACGAPLSALGGGDIALASGGLARLVRARVLASYPHGDPSRVPSAPAQASMPDISAPPAAAGPGERVDPRAAVLRRGVPAGAQPLASSAVPVLTAAYATFGYGTPLLALLAGAWALAARGRRAFSRARRVFAIALALTVAFQLLVLTVEVLR